MTFLELIEKTLEASNKPMHYQDIWKKAEELGLDKQLPIPKQGERKTPWDTVAAQLYVDINKNPNSIFEKVGKGLFVLKNKGIDIEKVQEDLSKKELRFKESEMHPKLVSYLSELGTVAKTINAARVQGGKRQGEMKWGTPDIVGVYFRDDLDKNILKFCSTANIPTIEIYAYELKTEVLFSNYTECFFQAVSNSSWANEGWLVAVDFEDEPEFEKELERLNQSFGIGILELNMDDPIGSKIKYPARSKNNLDLDTVNKLCKNDDFKDFFIDIENLLHQNSEMRNMSIEGMRRNKKFDAI